MQNGNAHPETKTNPETKTIPIENGSMLQSQDKGVTLDCLASISLYDQWVGPPVNGPRPKARYEVLPCFQF